MQKTCRHTCKSGSVCTRNSFPIRGQTRRGREKKKKNKKKLPEGCNMNRKRNEFKVKGGEMAEEEKLFHMRGE
jgi:hypothetical protein